MSVITLEEAQSRLPEIIARLEPGEEVLITSKDAEPFAQLRLYAPRKGQPVFGNCKGMLTILAEDDEHLEDFRDYLT